MVSTLKSLLKCVVPLILVTGTATNVQSLRMKKMITNGNRYRLLDRGIKTGRRVTPLTSQEYYTVKDSIKHFGHKKDLKEYLRKKERYGKGSVKFAKFVRKQFPELLSLASNRLDTVTDSEPSDYEPSDYESEPLPVHKPNINIYTLFDSRDNSMAYEPDSAEIRSIRNMFPDLNLEKSRFGKVSPFSFTCKSREWLGDDATGNTIQLPPSVYEKIYQYNQHIDDKAPNYRRLGFDRWLEDESYSGKFNIKYINMPKIQTRPPIFKLTWQSPGGRQKESDQNSDQESESDAESDQDIDHNFNLSDESDQVPIYHTKYVMSSPHISGPNDENENFRKEKQNNMCFVPRNMLLEMYYGGTSSSGKDNHINTLDIEIPDVTVEVMLDTSGSDYEPPIKHVNRLDTMDSSGDNPTDLKTKVIFQEAKTETSLWLKLFKKYIVGVLNFEEDNKNILRDNIERATDENDDDNASDQEEENLEEELQEIIESVLQSQNSSSITEDNALGVFEDFCESLENHSTLKVDYEEILERVNRLVKEQIEEYLIETFKDSKYKTLNKGESIIVVDTEADTELDEKSEYQIQVMKIVEKNDSDSAATTFDDDDDDEPEVPEEKDSDSNNDVEAVAIFQDFPTNNTTQKSDSINTSAFSHLNLELSNRCADFSEWANLQDAKRDGRRRDKIEQARLKMEENRLRMEEKRLKQIEEEKKRVEEERRKLEEEREREEDEERRRKEKHDKKRRLAVLRRFGGSD